MQRWIAVSIALALASGCGKNDNDNHAAAQQQATAVQDRGADLADLAKAQQQQAIEHLEKLEAKGDAYWGDAEKHAQAAIEAVRPYADKAGTSVSSIIVSGKQAADKVGAISREIMPKIDAGLGIRVIYEKIGDAGAEAALDKAIGHMPRTEVIDGLTVGFSPQGTRQYLVVWRQGDTLIGFVYTSLIDRAIEEVVKQAPGIIKLIRTAADKL